jgi:M6 family metalloprotease-like protein
MKIYIYLLFVLAVLLQCSKTEVTPETVTPTITTFSPTEGTSGTSITINGTNFTGTSSVSFGDTPAASFIVTSATSINAIVGNGASGNVKVTTGKGSASLPGFSFKNLEPSIASFSPTEGTTGTSITIKGKNFTGSSAVSFGDSPAASFIVTSDSILTAIVGNGASGNVKVTTAKGSVSLPGFSFKNPVPTIASFTPTSATTTNLVTITGTNFIGTTSVSFGEAAAASFTVVSATTINAVVGAGASGDIKITNPGGSASIKGFTYINTYVPCKLADFTNNANGVNLGFPRRSHWVKSVGTVKVTTLFVDFSDAPATRTPEDVFKQYISPSSENFLGTISYGKQIINFDTQFQWLRMSKRSTEYGWSALTGDLHRAYNREAALLADPKVDFSTTDVLLVVTNPDAAAISNGPASPSIPGRGIMLDGKEILNFTNSGKDLVGWNGLWFPHEFGHLMGLADLYSYSDPTRGHKFVGEFSMMGLIAGKAPEYFGWERWLLGWLNDNQVICSNGLAKGIVTLTPIERKDGIKLLIIPIDANSTLVVESRRNIGYDSRIPKSGPLVYLVNTKIASGSGTISVLPINESDQSKLQLPLSLNQSLSYNNIVITFLASDGNGDTIQYEKK